MFSIFLNKSDQFYLNIFHILQICTLYNDNGLPNPRLQSISFDYIYNKSIFHTILLTVVAIYRTSNRRICFLTLHYILFYLILNRTKCSHTSITHILHSASHHVYRALLATNISFLWHGSGPKFIQQRSCYH